MDFGDVDRLCKIVCMNRLMYEQILIWLSYRSCGRQDSFLSVRLFCHQVRDESSDSPYTFSLSALNDRKEEML